MSTLDSIKSIFTGLEHSIHTAGIAEPGYASPPSGIVIIANWNNPPENAALSDAEALGCEGFWGDEWRVCEDCQKLVRVQPDSHEWKPIYIQTGDGLIHCQDCILASDLACELYLCSIEGNPLKNVSINLDPEKYGYVKILEDQQNGLYGGQSADPRVIAQSLREKEVTRFIFKIDSVGQFDLTFSTYVFEDEVKQANDGPIETNAKEDPAVALERGLRAAAAQVGHPVAGQVKIATIHGDGTATTRTLTNQEFIEGRK